MASKPDSRLYNAIALWLLNFISVVLTGVIAHLVITVQDLQISTVNELSTIRLEYNNKFGIIESRLAILEVQNAKN